MHNTHITAAYEAIIQALILPANALFWNIVLYFHPVKPVKIPDKDSQEVNEDNWKLGDTHEKKLTSLSIPGYFLTFNLLFSKSSCCRQPSKIEF